MPSEPSTAGSARSAIDRSPPASRVTPADRERSGSGSCSSTTTTGDSGSGSVDPTSSADTAEGSSTVTVGRSPVAGSSSASSARTRPPRPTRTRRSSPASTASGVSARATTRIVPGHSRSTRAEATDGSAMIERRASARSTSTIASPRSMPDACRSSSRSSPSGPSTTMRSTSNHADRLSATADAARTTTARATTSAVRRRRRRSACTDRRRSRMRGSSPGSASTIRGVESPVRSRSRSDRSRLARRGGLSVSVTGPPRPRRRTAGPRPCASRDAGRRRGPDAPRGPLRPSGRTRRRRIRRHRPG